MVGFLPVNLELELLQGVKARRDRYDAYLRLERSGDVQAAQRLSKWAKVAPQLPHTILLPLAKEGVDPESQIGADIIRRAGADRQLRLDRAFQDRIRAKGPITLNAAEPGFVEHVQAPQVEQAGFVGDVGGALGRVGHVLKNDVVDPVRRGLDISSAQQNLTAERANIPRVDLSVKTGSRYATGALQSGAEALDTALTYRSPYAAPPVVGNAPNPQGTQHPFSLNQFTLYQMLHGADSGAGYFPSGEAVQKAAETQRQVRGTVGGHALTPGRLFASTFVEPGTRPFQLMSGLVDASIDWKLDPAAIALTEIGDVRQARQIFDTYGAVNGSRLSLHGPTAAAWLDSRAGDKVAAAIANTSSITELMRRTKNKWPADLYAALVDARNPETVKEILRPMLGGQIRDVPTWGYDFMSALSDARWANTMPHGTIDINDKDHAIETVRRLLVTAKVDPATTDKVVYRVAKAPDRPSLFDAVVHGAGDAMAGTLEKDFGVSRRDAKRLTTFFQDSTDADRQFFVGAMGDTPHVPGMTVDGNPVPIVGPHIPSELLNQTIPIPDARELRHAASRLRPLLDMPGVAQSHALMDWFTQKIFKVGALARLAWPVRVVGEEQVRQATAGLDSAFRHPISWISWVVGKKGATDITEIPFGQLSDDLFFDALSKPRAWRNFGPADELDKIYSKHWTPIRKGADGFERAWADELSHLHLDPVTKKVAQATRDSSGLDAVKDWFWKSDYRTEMANSGGWRTNLNDRTWSDAYIDSVLERVKVTTAEHPDLLDAVAEGANMRKGMRVNQNFVKRLETLVDNGVGPDVVKGRIGVTVKKGASQQVAAGVNRAVDGMFNVLMSKPTNTLSRSPAFKQFYWQRMEELYGELAPDVQRQVARVAGNERLTSTLGKFRQVAKSGELGLEDADLVAKAFALDSTKRLLYDVTERSHFFDAARIVFPFGEAWKEVLSVWAKLAVNEPQTVRRAQQVIQGARQSGFFYTDPQDGNEYFTIPFSQWLTKHTVGVPYPMRALVGGLNIVGQGLPGVGPAVQIPVASLIPDQPQWDAVREAVAPYGTADSVDISNFFPGWVQKYRTAGWLKPFFGPSGDQERIYENTIKDVMGYLVSTGAYDPTDPEDIAKLTQDAKNKAKGLYALRGMVQFAAPAAPAFVPKVKAKDGKLYEVWRMAKDYRDLQNEDFNTATEKFIAKYGEKAFLAANPKTIQQVYNPPTTKQAKWWVANNRQFADAYPHVSGFFAPGSGDFDYNAYLRALDQGQIDQLSPREWLEAANHRLASQIYANKRAQVGNSPNAAQQDWLREWKQELLDKYPGYDPEGTHGKDISPGKAMIELRQAAQDPTVKNTVFAKAVDTYFTKRDEALAAAKQAGYASLEADRLRPLRDWLREWGDELAHRSSQFQAAWDYLLYQEVSLEKEQTVGSQ